MQNNMATKKSMKESRGRKWSEDELKEFASVLADGRTDFALTFFLFWVVWLGRHTNLLLWLCLFHHLPSSEVFSFSIHFSVTNICISKSCLSWRPREIDFKSCNAAMLEFKQFVRISRA